MKSISILLSFIYLINVIGIDISSHYCATSDNHEISLFGIKIGQSCTCLFGEIESKEGLSCCKARDCEDKNLTVAPKKL
jgi:hypothetical protein